MPQYIGRVTLTVDGTKLDSQKGAKINLGGVARTAVETDHAIGFTEERKAATIEAVVPVSRETPLEFIRNLTGATAVFLADTGQGWTVKNAFVTDTLDIGDGKVTVKLAGDPAEAL